MEEKLKNSGIYINEDYCKDTMLLRKELREKIKELSQKNIKAKIIYNKIVYLKNKK